VEFNAWVYVRGLTNYGNEVSPAVLFMTNPYSNGALAIKVDTLFHSRVDRRKDYFEKKLPGRFFSLTNDVSFTGLWF